MFSGESGTRKAKKDTLESESGHADECGTSLIEDVLTGHIVLFDAEGVRFVMKSVDISSWTVLQYQSGCDLPLYHVHLLLLLSHFCIPHHCTSSIEQV